MATWLIALTDEARRALKGDQRVIDEFPFKVGRESRTASGVWTSGERRVGQAPQLNDVYLVDVADVLNVSREHFQIEAEADRFFLTDRGSACGTLVEGRKVGGNRTRERVELRDHDVIVVGTASSPYVFKFRTG